ncbi:uncharacterized protein LOC135700038 [Ochlerotatus camptorhynchus]|uniref:uncharacterized protein LOC135700038 n=1 Tax=Ochlerotatus camptorhynchus TaxID=644619 RepID=UPI0031CF2C36
MERIHDMMIRAGAGGVTVYHLETYLRLVDSCYDEFNLIQNEVYVEFPDLREEQEIKFIDFEQDLRVEICTALETFRKKQIVPQVALPAPVPVALGQPAIANQVPGLPHVPLPSFDGTYEKWFRFKQLFQDLMQKYPGLSDATKLHYLTLEGKAENVINEQILNENNFDAAWNVLVERFENKRTILDLHTHGIINLPKMKNESAAELRKLVDECSHECGT